MSSKYAYGGLKRYACLHKQRYHQSEAMRYVVCIGYSETCLVSLILYEVTLLVCGMYLFVVGIHQAFCLRLVDRL